ncbi:hypothetical protein [Flavobacterium sp. W20_MBD1_R3]|jgi:hypothetical protein|uniref:hypothetical protein n=1 Tax=Flavobacterium sp. W20_MBD1_R3 TaxID=3240278 RepID=UPI003F904395
MNEEDKILIEKLISKFKQFPNNEVHKDSFATMVEDPKKRSFILNILVNELKLIDDIDTQLYRINLKGLNFTSFKEIEEKELAKAKAVSEKEKLEIDLAKSNIDANILNREVAERNFKSERFNKKMSILNFIFIICNFCILIWQIITSVK